MGSVTSMQPATMRALYLVLHRQSLVARIHHQIPFYLSQSSTRMRFLVMTYPKGCILTTISHDKKH
jgi:hypothetical protein